MSCRLGEGEPRLSVSPERAGVLVSCGSYMAVLGAGAAACGGKGRRDHMASAARSAASPVFAFQYAASGAVLPGPLSRSCECIAVPGFRTARRRYGCAGL